MILATLHIEGMSEAFPRLYVMEQPGMKDIVSWAHTNAFGNVTKYSGEVANIHHQYDIFYKLTIKNVKYSKH